MTPPFHTLQGTWEEIKTHDAELTGREVRVIVLDKIEPAPDPSHLPPAERFAAARRLAQAQEDTMRFTDPGDTQKLLREARNGGN